MARNNTIHPDDQNCLIYIVLAIVVLFIAYVFMEVEIWAGIFIIALIALVMKLIIVTKAEEAKQLIEKRKEILDIQRANKNKKAIQQIKYKERIDKFFEEIKTNPEVINVLENFLPQIPVSLFTYKDCYTYFEYLVWKKYEIGREVLWSSSTDLFNMTRMQKQKSLYLTLEGTSQKLSNSIRLHRNEILSFFNDGYAKMTKLLMSMVVFEEESDYTFVLLRLIQLSAPCFIRESSQQVLGIDSSDTQTLPLEECAFRYYKKFVDNALEDSALSIFTFLMLHYKKFGEVDNIDYYNYPRRREEIIKFLVEKKEDFDFKIFQSNMKKKAHKIEEGCSINDVDLMTGIEFENFVAKLFSKMGYITEVTKHSGDFGVDVIAEKDETKIGIQAKCYTNPVSNSAIQEITAGMKYYDCQKGIVVTNSTFTKAAIELARLNSIQLWDRKMLEEKISELF